MDAPFRIASLVFNSGDVVDTSESDVVVLVGPNNCGKSRTLQEIATRIRQNQHSPWATQEFFALNRVDLHRGTDSSGVADWLRENRYTWTDPHDLLERTRYAYSSEFAIRNVGGYWEGPDERLGELGALLTRTLWCGERLTYLGAAGRPDPETHPEQPIHYLLKDPERLADFRRRFSDAFGLNLILDGWGASLQLRVSPSLDQDAFSAHSSSGLPDPDLTARLRSLPTIETQSDGVRSFGGILLTLLSGRDPLVLLDEPEAFLHPPQARLIGRSLGELQQSGQVFVATHSLDVLLGLVESRPARVLVVRLTRASGRTSAQVLPPTQLHQLWRDPLLRFSRALDGLFHDGVIVCEGDTDSQFYSTVASEDGTELLGGRDACSRTPVANTVSHSSLELSPRLASLSGR